MHEPDDPADRPWRPVSTPSVPMVCESIVSGKSGAMFQYSPADTNSGTFSYVSSGFDEMFGLPFGAVLANAEAFFAAIHPDDADPLRCWLSDASPASHWRRSFRINHPVHGERRIELQAASDRWNGALLWQGFLSDVTERSSPLAKFGVFSHAHEGLIVCDAAGIIIDANAMATTITGYACAEVIGNTPRLFKSGLQGPEFYQRMWNDIETHGYWEGELWNRHKNGTAYAERLTISVIGDGEGRVTHYVGSFSDITALKMDEDRIKHLSQYDLLTCLPNSAHLEACLAQSLTAAARDNSLLAVCYLDLDGLKIVNQTHGYMAGDQVLLRVAERLKAALRGNSDTAARMGGGEFVLLLNDMASIAECRRIARRVLDAIAEPIMVDSDGTRVGVALTANMGVTLSPYDGADAYSLLRHANRALCRAMALERNCFALFDPEQDQKSKIDRDAIARIRQALVHNEFRLYYQPKVDMRSGKVIGFEALIRWQHPERGLLLPAEFLPLILKTDVDIAIGQWVLAEGLRELDAWNRQGLDCTLSVNISATHLLTPTFITDIAVLLQVYGDVDPNRLELELVESSALEDLDAAIGVFKNCRAMGLRIALDDFGTGYSSLSYFRRFPVDTVKIDQMFVRAMQDDESDRSIVQSVTGLANAFRRTVIAEGVETVAQVQLLRQLGCNIGQGYGFAKPMPAAEVVKWVASYAPHPSWYAEPCRMP